VNQEIKKRWAEGLKSGDYEQTTAMLYHPNDGYCCLGVLADLYLKEGGFLANEIEETSYESMIRSCSASNMGDMLSAELLQWAGLSLAESEVLAAMNDDGGDFQTIAEYIEETL
jgi:hypothetical protein